LQYSGQRSSRIQPGSGSEGTASNQKVKRKQQPLMIIKIVRLKKRNSKLRRATIPAFALTHPQRTGLAGGTTTRTEIKENPKTYLFEKANTPAENASHKRGATKNRGGRESRVIKNNGERTIPNNRKTSTDI